MSETWAYAGGALLVLATIPQVAKLLRTRRADDLAWGFVLLNVAGIALLAARSWEIGETAFLALNVTTALFWLLVAAIKIRSRPRANVDRMEQTLASPRSAAKKKGSADIGI